MQKRIKSGIALLLCAVLAVIPLSGVKDSFSVQNVEKSAMVKSIGFDAQPQALISYVTSVIEDNSASHAQGVISAPGKSFAEAEKKAQILADKYLSFSYAKHFLIGMQTARQDIRAVLNFMLASNVLQLSSYIYLCEDSAQQILTDISKDSISTNEVLTNLNLAGKEEGYYYPVTVLELAKAEEEHKCIALPIIGHSEAGDNTGKKTVLVFKGYGVLKDHKLQTVLGLSQARAYNLLMNKVERTVVECGACDFLLKRMQARKHFVMQGDRVQTVRLTLKTHAAFASFGGASLADKAYTDSFMQKEQQILLAEMNSLLRLMRQTRLDILDLESALEIQTWGRVKHPAQALKSAAYEVIIEQKQEKSYTLTGGI